MSPESSGRSYDVVIVGGGVSGAVIASELARAKKSVLLLEAGSDAAADPVKYAGLVDTFQGMGALRGLPNGPYPINLAALSPNDAHRDPYFVQLGRKQFQSDYLRMLGGSTLHWQGTTLRMVPNDFRMQSMYGQASDWPISYDDLEPDYTRAEAMLGVSANVEDQANFGIWFESGYVFPMERMPQSFVDQFFDAGLQDATVELHGGRYPLRVISLATARNSRPNAAFDRGKGYVPVGAVGNAEVGMRCQGNSSCSPICPVQAKYNALKTLEQAQRQGDVEVRAQCVASRLRIDSASGRVEGVEYKRYVEPGVQRYVSEFARGTIVILAANAIENAMLMLASDVVDVSGQLGRNLMDHPYISFQGLASKPVYPFRGPDVTSGVETLRDGRFRERHAAFRASIGNWGWVGEPASSVTELVGQARFGASLRNAVRDKFTRMVKLGVFLEQLPESRNRVRIDPRHCDAAGNYLPVIDYDYADYTLDGGVAAISKVWPEITRRVGIVDHTDFSKVSPGFQSVSRNDTTFTVMGPGHIVGTHRMGNDPTLSVVNADQRSWAHPNLYAAGAGSMVTIGTANPTLTLAALSIRTARQLIKELRP